MQDSKSAKRLHRGRLIAAILPYLTVLTVTIVSAVRAQDLEPIVGLYLAVPNDVLGLDANSEIFPLMNRVERLRAVVEKREKYLKARTSEDGTLEIALLPPEGGRKMFAISNTGISTQRLKVFGMSNNHWTDISAQSLPKISDQYIIQRYSKVFPEHSAITADDLRWNSYPTIWYRLPKDGSDIIAVSGLEKEPEKELFRMRFSQSKFVVEE